MRQLWAPWRMEFIRKPKDGSCFLCEAFGADPARDRENLVLDRGAAAFVIMNLYPYNNGHLLIATSRHEGDFELLTDAELAELASLARRWTGIVRRSMKAEGANLGLNLGRAAGAGVEDHLHLHLVPRWKGDTNFMPVAADVHVVPQALAELYDQLLQEAARGPEGGGA